MKKIKVNLLGEEHSAGRGVGFYRSHLQAASEKTGQIEFVSEGPDLIHYPFFDLFYPTLPRKHTSPTVVTIHDLTPLVLKEYYPMGFRALAALTRQRQALSNVDAVITDSLSSKKDIVDIFHFDPEKVFVTHLAADEAYAKKPTQKYLEEIKEKYHLPEKFALYVGGVNPNKNLVRLAKAASELALPVVFVGSEFTEAPVETFSWKKLLGLQKVHPEVAEFAKLKAVIEGNPKFKLLGYVPTEELNAIYRLAAFYCQPSLYEGFGLPVLEAMTAGCLVVCANTGSLPEIYPLETITFSPDSEKEIEQALEKAQALKPKEKADLIRAGKEKSADFSWEKTAETTIGVYLSVLS